MDDSLLTVFETTFEKIFDVFMTDLPFPPPIGSVSPFELFAFFTVSFVLAELVMRIASRRDAD